MYVQTKKGEENVSFNVNRLVSDEAWTEKSSEFLQSWYYIKLYLFNKTVSRPLI